MTFRAPPLPTNERAEHTARLIREGSSDTGRWAKLDSLATQWDSRAAMAARFIPPGQRVLDIGAGAMALRGQLAADCSYFPADIVSRCAGCQVIDLNKGEFPTGNYDWITFLGVLEYVHDPVPVLALAGATAPNMILTYCTMNGGEEQARRGMGWVTDFTVREVEGLLARARWGVLERVEVKRGPGNIQYLFVAKAG
ncbi:MAG TPA: hypothetical protein VFG64_11475 [Dongiaceae bacterium]|nr:hypothetical protein [Dongiaceae bacterium]